MQKILLRIYGLAWYLSLPLVLGYLWRRGRKASEYRKRWAERLGLSFSGEGVVDIWVHAVSLGEVVAVSPLVSACLARGYRVLMTSMTPTGSAQIKRRFAHQVLHQYCPYDFGFARQGFLARYQPQLAVMVETELWPGWLSDCQQRRIPVILVNGRISPRSYGRYRASSWLWQRLLPMFSALYVQSETDKQRFLSLGADASRVQVVGNLKFHPQELGPQLERWRLFKANYPEAKFMIFASTHPQEEEKLLKAWVLFKAKHPDWISIWAPRHPERFGSVYDLLKSQIARTELYSHASLGKELEALVVDSMGELAAVYSIADLAFVGGSLVPIGGHNILEPMVFGLGVITGPFMHNQADLLRLALEQEVIIQVKNEIDLCTCMLNLAEQDQDREVLAKKTKVFFNKNQQALSLCLQGIEDLIKPRKA